MSHAINYFGRNLTAYRASFHNHSTVSDGAFTPAEIIRLYREHGYEIFAFTDHFKTNPVSTYDGLGMQLVSGMEVHPWGPRSERWHLLSLGVPEDFADPSAESAQAAIDAVRKAGGIVFCAHPAWCGFRTNDVETLKGLSGIEVYNSSTRYGGKGFNMHIWDELADDGILYNALAVDDTHLSRELFGGWTMVLTDKPLSQAVVLDALRRGDFYATQGPEIKRIAFDGETFEAEFSPCTEVIGVTNTWRSYVGTVENFEGPDYGAPEITTCRFTRKYDTPHYLRLQLRDKNGKYAWSNPVFFK